MDYSRLYNEQDFQKFQEQIERDIDVGMTNKAISKLLEALKHCHNHAGVYYLLGFVYYKAKDYMKSTQYLKQAIYFEPNNDVYVGLLSVSFFELADYEQAQSYAEQAYEMNPNNIDALLTLARIALVNRNELQAETLIQKVLDMDGKNFEALRLLSKCYMQKGEETDKVIESLKRAKKYGNDEELEFDIIKTLYIGERFDECLKQCKRVMIKNPNSYAAQKAREIVQKIKRRQAGHTTEARQTQTNNQNAHSKRETASLEEALAKLHELIGLDAVKLEIERIVKLIQFEKKRTELLGIPNDNNQSYHFMFLGNPGTGKTTVARLLGDIFYYLGILEKGHLVEVDRSSIVGQYIGQTAQLTKEAIDKAMGGVLFIDEAYALARGGTDSNDFGPEAIDTLIKAMEDQRGNFIVILAGYTDEMRQLMKLNPGLKNRINISILFENYSDEELLKIAKKMASERYYQLSEDGEKAFLEKINREKADEHFANARTARNIIEAAIREKAFRIGNRSVSKAELSTLEAADFGIELNGNVADSLDTLWQEFDQMVGLENVKEMIKKVVSFVQLQNKKKEIGMKSNDISLNMVFLGNPGTGKTTVARLVGKILNAIGVLKKGHLVEVTRDDLVGQYIGQTGPKTLDKIKEAYGGILFIDEAYSLKGSSENDFGHEAIATLIKEMEDNRDKLVVIMAGYTEEMEDLLDVNPGLASRVGYTIEFPDYHPDELMQIFEFLSKAEDYQITDAAKERLHVLFEKLYADRDRNFGNGRLVRKYFEQIKMQQAERIIVNQIEGKDMLTIVEEDVVEALNI